MDITGNVRQDDSLLFVTVQHPNVGMIVINANLVDVKTSQISDTTEISDPGIGGGRVIKFKKDNAKKIEVEVQTLSEAENYFRRVRRYKSIPFSIQWSDNRNITQDPQGGVGLECYLMDSDNERTAETATFEIISLSYSGD